MLKKFGNVKIRQTLFMNIMWVKLKKTLHYLLKATRAPAGGFVDVFEIRVVETYQTDLKNSIEKSFS